MDVATTVLLVCLIVFETLSFVLKFKKFYQLLARQPSTAEHIRQKLEEMDREAKEDRRSCFTHLHDSADIEQRVSERLEMDTFRPLRSALEHIVTQIREIHARTAIIEKKIEAEVARGFSLSTGEHDMLREILQKIDGALAFLPHHGSNPGSASIHGGPISASPTFQARRVEQQMEDSAGDRRSLPSL